MFSVIFRAPIANAPIRRRRPIALDAQALGGNRHGVRRGQTSDVAEGGGRDVAVQSKQQKVADRGVVQSFRNVGVLAQTIERVAEKKKLSELGIVEGLHPKMVARAKQQFP